MISADRKKAVMHPIEVEPTSRRLKYLLSSLEEELTFEDTRSAVRAHLSGLRVQQVRPTGEGYWTMVDGYGTVFQLAEGNRWKVFVEECLAEKDQEHVLEALINLFAQINQTVQHQAVA